MEALAIVYGITCILVGILFAFFGLKHFRFIAGLIGFLFLSLIANVIINEVDPNLNSGVRIGILFGVGFVGALLCVFLWKLAIMALGGLGGYSLANFIIGVVPGGLINSNVGKIILTVCLVALGLVLAYFFIRWIIIIGTSMAGTSMLIYGADAFASTGYVRSITNPNADLSKVDSTVQLVYMGLYIGIFVLAVCIQVFVTGRNIKEPGKKIDSEETRRSEDTDKEQGRSRNIWNRRWRKQVSNDEENNGENKI